MEKERPGCLGARGSCRCVSFHVKNRVAIKSQPNSRRTKNNVEMKARLASARLFRKCRDRENENTSWVLSVFFSHVQLRMHKQHRTAPIHRGSGVHEEIANSQNKIENYRFSFVPLWLRCRQHHRTTACERDALHTRYVHFPVHCTTCFENRRGKKVKIKSHSHDSSVCLSLYSMRCSSMIIMFLCANQMSETAIADAQWTFKKTHLQLEMYIFFFDQFNYTEYVHSCLVCGLWNHSTRLSRIQWYILDILHKHTHTHKHHTFDMTTFEPALHAYLM